MRTINFDDSMTIHCCHCGQVVETISKYGSVGYFVDDIVRSEVGLSVGNNRAGFDWVDDKGRHHQSRVSRYHSCGQCTARLIDIIDMYYDDPLEFVV